MMNSRPYLRKVEKWRNLDKARYEAEYRFFELLVNMVNAENVVNMVNIIEAGEEKMIYVRDIWI